MASGYDLSGKNPFRLMKGRLGVYDKKLLDLKESSIEGIRHQAAIFKSNGGNLQQERMIKDKRRSLDRAVWYSYQAAEIIKVNAENKKPVRALINPNKVLQDYDEKILSVGYEYNIQCGDVFEWLGTKTHWLVYLQDATELAYFRGDIRKCSYKVQWEDEDGIYTTYAALGGSKETTISTSTNHGISIDTPNYSLSLLMPKTEKTLKFFKRYQKFYLQGEETCWRVEAVNWLNIPGVIEVHAAEYYANEFEDDIENGVVGGLIIEEDNPNTEDEEASILGETFIKVKKTYNYQFNGMIAENWYVDPKYPVILTVDPTDARKVSLKWDSSYCGQFDLFYGEHKKTIIVESLF